MVINLAPTKVTGHSDMVTSFYPCCCCSCLCRTASVFSVTRFTVVEFLIARKILVGSSNSIYHKELWWATTVNSLAEIIVALDHKTQYPRGVGGGSKHATNGQLGITRRTQQQLRLQGWPPLQLPLLLLQLRRHHLFPGHNNLLHTGTTRDGALYTLILYNYVNVYWILYMVF